MHSPLDLMCICNVHLSEGSSIIANTAHWIEHERFVELLSPFLLSNERNVRVMHRECNVTVAEPFLRFGNFNRGTFQWIKWREREIVVNKRSAETDKNQECTTLFISLLHSTFYAALYTDHPLVDHFIFRHYYSTANWTIEYWSSRSTTIFVVPDYLLRPVAEPPSDWFFIERRTVAIKGSIWIDRTPPPHKYKKLKSYCCRIIAFSMRWRGFKIGLEFMAWQWGTEWIMYCVLCAGSFEPLELRRSFKSWTILMVRRIRKKKYKFVSKVLKKINWGSINWSIDLARGHYRRSLWCEFDSRVLHYRN